jgi:Mce-associated membrane protein
VNTPETPTGRKTTIDTQPSTDVPDVIEDETTEAATEEAAGDTADAAHTADDAQEFDEAFDEAAAESARRWGRIGAIVLAVLLVISAITAATLYFVVYQPDQATGPRAQDAVLADAKAGAAAVLSYSPDSLEGDLSKAKSHLTGEFLNYYSDFVESTVRPAVRTKHVSTSAEVVRAAIIEMHPTTAKVLAFVNQATTSDTLVSPKVSQSSIRMELQKVGSSWLISDFKPV